MSLTDLCISVKLLSRYVCEFAVTKCDTGISIEKPQGYAVLVSLDFRNLFFI